MRGFAPDTDSFCKAFDALARRVAKDKAIAVARREFLRKVKQFRLYGCGGPCGRYAFA